MNLKKLKKAHKKSEAAKIEYKKRVGFHVYRSEDKNLPFNEWTRLTAVPRLGKNFQDKNCAPGKIYFYKLTDVDAYGFESEPYEPENGYWIDEQGNRIKHNPLNDVIGYYIYRSTDPNLPLEQWERLNAKPKPTTGFTDKDVKKGITYYYYVTAVSAAGLESPPTDIVSCVGK